MSINRVNVFIILYLLFVHGALIIYIKMTIYFYFSKIYIRNNLFEIYYSYSNLIALEIIETKSSKG